MKRSLALGLATAALALAGCGQNGGYRLSWNFYATPDTTGPTESAAAGCGQHGVDSIAVFATDTTGDAQEVRAFCTPGWVTSSVPDGTWTLSLQMLDAQGQVIPSSPASPIGTQPVAADRPPAQFSFTFVPLPSCGDRVDNNGNGLVDQADPACDGGTTANAE